MKSTAPRIVIINDEPILLKAFETLIRSRFKNSEFLLFSNSREAWQELSRTEPDLVITGDRMPGMF